MDSSPSDEEAKEFVGTHVVVKDSWFEIPVSFKTGVKPMPHNLA